MQANNGCNCVCNTLPDPNKYLYYSTRDTNQMLQTQVFNASFMFRGETERIRLFNDISEALPLFLMRDRIPGRIVSICSKVTTEDGMTTLQWTNWQFQSENYLDWEDRNMWAQVSAGSGGEGGGTVDPSLVPVTQKDINVILGEGEDQGSYSDGDIVFKGTQLEEVLRKMLQKQIPPEYIAPTVTGLDEVVDEVGKPLPNVSLTFIQNDAGPLTSWAMFLSDQKVTEGFSAVITYNLNTYQFSDELMKLKTEVVYSEGPIKNDNLGNPYSEGHITAGKLSFFKNFTGKRYSWYGVDSKDINVSNSQAVRALSNPAFLKAGDSFDIVFPAGTKCIVIAVPAKTPVLNIVEKTTQLPVFGSFTQTDLQVNGYNNFTAADYKIYKLNVAAGLQQGTYTVTI